MELAKKTKNTTHLEHELNEREEDGLLGGHHRPSEARAARKQLIGAAVVHARQHGAAGAAWVPLQGVVPFQ